MPDYDAWVIEPSASALYGATDEFHGAYSGVIRFGLTEVLGSENRDYIVLGGGYRGIADTSATQRLGLYDIISDSYVTKQSGPVSGDGRAYAFCGVYVPPSLIHSPLSYSYLSPEEMGITDLTTTPDTVKDFLGDPEPGINEQQSGVQPRGTFWHRHFANCDDDNPTQIYHGGILHPDYQDTSYKHHYAGVDHANNLITDWFEVAANVEIEWDPCSAADSVGLIGVNTEVQACPGRRHQVRGVQSEIVYQEFTLWHPAPKRVFVAGGAMSGVNPSVGAIFCWNAEGWETDNGTYFEEDVWETMNGKLEMPGGGTTDAHRGRSHGAAVTIDNRYLFCIMGKEAYPVLGAYSDRVSVFDMELPWYDAEPQDPAPYSAAYVAAAVLNGEIHVAGGYDGDAMDFHISRNPFGGTWTIHAPLPSARYGGVLSETEGRLFYSGGKLADGSITAEHWEWLAAPDIWVPRAPMPGARFGATGQGHNDGDPSINVFGGIEPPGEDSGDITFTNYRYFAEPTVVGSSSGDPSYVPATPRHVFVGPDGTVAYPLVQNWKGVESAAGGQISSAGTVRRKDIDAAPNAFQPGADWWVFGKETHDTVFHSKVKGPGGQHALVEIGGNGPGRLLDADPKRALWRADGPDYWVVGQDDPFAAAEPPATKPLIPDENILDSQGAGLNGGVDPYEWAVTFVTAEFETGLGPARSLALDPLDQFFHVTLVDIPIGPAATTSRKVYRRDTGATNFKLLTTIADNTTTTYTDSTADGALGANAPADIASSAISIDVRKGSIVLSVVPDTPILATDRADLLAPFEGADVTHLHMVIHQTKSLPNWEVIFSYGEAPDGVMTDFLTLDLDGLESKEVDQAVPQAVDSSMVRARLHRKTDGTETTGFVIRMRAMRVYGMASDDDYTTSDIARDVYARIGISDAGVKESTLPALPQDFPGGTWRDPMDEMGGLAGYSWGVWKEGLNDVGYYFPPTDTVWLYCEPEFPRDLVAQQMYNELTLNILRSDGVVVRSVTCHANPDPLDDIVTYPAIDLVTPVSVEKATQMCQRIVNELATRRWAGSVRFRAVKAPDGSLVHGNLVKAGQSIWFPPPINAALTIDLLEKGNTLAIANFTDRVPLIDLFERHNRLLRERRRGT